jgi:predicted dehydrogenase
MDRKTFVKTSTVATVGTVLGAPAVLKAKQRSSNTIRIGFIGTGLRGRNHVNNILATEGVECPAFCDIDPDAVDKTLAMFEEKNKPKPVVYSANEYSYQEMLAKEDLDGVIISTNWRWHTAMCIAAMEEGVYAGAEVSGAFSVDECWELVNCHERTGTHLMFLENVCYRRDVMAVLNMVRDNIFGELVHFRGGYQHDLRTVKFNDGNGGLMYGDGSYGEARWRTAHSEHRNGDLYPTHGLGPIATYMDMNRGNRLVSVSSHATKARSLKHFAKNHPDGGENHPYTKINWKLGDIVTSTITTARGETIILTHDTNLPRPYSLGFRVQGVDGLAEFDYYTKRVHVEGISESHRWDFGNEWFEKYDHELWKKYGEEAVGGGHGGMDFFLDRAFVESVRRGIEPVLDVYDAAVMRVITPLSEISIQEGGTPQPIPDFTEGKWITRNPVFGLGDL